MLTENHDLPETRLKNNAEAARYIHISPRTMWTLGATGEIPVVRIRGAVRFDAADLDAFIEAQKQKKEGRPG